VFDVIKTRLVARSHQTVEQGEQATQIHGLGHKPRVCPCFHGAIQVMRSTMKAQTTYHGIGAHRLPQLSGNSNETPSSPAT
jgi:hypothetical protein